MRRTMMTDKIHQLHIRIPEGITFSYALAGPLTRSLAWIVDACAVVVISICIGVVTSLLGAISSDLSQAVTILLYFAVSVGYGIVLEWGWGGQTLGKRVMRLRVMDARGVRLRLSQVMLRNLVRPVDGIPFFYMVGGVSCLLSRHAQRLGDLAAGTVVVRLPKLAAPDLSQVPEGKFNSFLAYPHLTARLRQAVSPAEAALALQALLRRDGLDLEARLKLYRDLADHFRTKIAFPQEVTDGISDEQYLRNVLGVAFRTRGGAGAASRP